MKRITLCADDYAITPGVSDAILTLGGQQRIHATSVLVTSPYWTQAEEASLKPLQSTMDIGLHLNFTEGSGLTRPFHQGLPGLWPMLWRSHCRLLVAEILEDEIQAQLDRFQQVMGVPPDFIDGHQHVHHLPQVRQALFRVLTRASLPKLWVRSVLPLINITSPLKSLIITASGAKAMRQHLNQSTFYNNSGFAGIYSLQEGAAFDQLMTSWLSQLPDRGLIMCHPGIADSQINADHSAARIKEFEYLSSSQFRDTLVNQRIKLSKLPQPSDS